MLAHMNPAQTAARPSPTPSQPGNINKVNKNKAKSKMPPGYKFGGFPTEILEPIIKQNIDAAIAEDTIDSYDPEKDPKRIYRTALAWGTQSPVCNELVDRYLKAYLEPLEKRLSDYENMCNVHTRAYNEVGHTARRVQKYRGVSIWKPCRTCKTFVDALKGAELVFGEVQKARRAVARVKKQGELCTGVEGWMPFWRGM